MVFMRGARRRIRNFAATPNACTIIQTKRTENVKKKKKNCQCSVSRQWALLVVVVAHSDTNTYYIHSLTHSLTVHRIKIDIFSLVVAFCKLYSSFCFSFLHSHKIETFFGSDSWFICIKTNCKYLWAFH